CYDLGRGVAEDHSEAVKWYRKAAEAGSASAQFMLGNQYRMGYGVPKDYVEAHKWFNLAGAQGNDLAFKNLSVGERPMTREQVAEAQRLAREFKPRKSPKPGESESSGEHADSQPSRSGTGFFITEEGFLITNEHVVKDATQVRLLTR